MLRGWLVIIASLLNVLWAEPAAARNRRHLDATPFAHAPCSVFDSRPCTPSTCSVFDHGPCIPEIDYPIGENLQLTIRSAGSRDDAATDTPKPDHDLDSIGALFAALRMCWTPPPEHEARAGMQMSVQFSFKRDGSLIAPPRITYAARDAPPQVRDVYRRAIVAALDACTPLTFSHGLGNAIAGRPLMVRYVDDRKIETPEIQP